MNSQIQTGRDLDNSPTTAGTDARISLLTDVDFKWLMAGQGWWIDTARMHNDACYAAGLLRLALESPSFALRECAAALQAQMNGLAPSA